MKKPQRKHFRISKYGKVFAAGKGSGNPKRADMQLKWEMRHVRTSKLGKMFTAGKGRR